MAVERRQLRGATDHARRGLSPLGAREELRVAGVAGQVQHREQVLTAGEPRSAILLQQLQQQLVPARRQVDQAAGRDGIAIEDAVRGSERGFVAGERVLSGGHLVEQHAEREEIRCRVGWLAAELLRRHVRHRPRHHLGERVLLRDGHGAPVPRQTEVEDLEHAVRAHHHVLGLEIAVHDAGVVRAHQRGGELLAQSRDGERRQTLALHHRAQGLALDPLHDDERRVGVLAEVVDGDDRRVVQRRGGARLAQRFRERVGALATAQRLDRDHPVEHRVAGAEDVAESTAADLVEDLEPTQAAGGGRLRRTARPSENPSACGSPRARAGPRRPPPARAGLIR